MKITKEKIYLIYILLGLSYFIFKVIFYICDFIYFRGIILGSIAALLTMSIGILSFREYKEKRYKKLTKLTAAHWLAALIPLIIIPLTPIIMIHNLGQGIFQIEKITILIIFECLAITQVILAFFMFRALKIKKMTKKRR